MKTTPEQNILLKQVSHRAAEHRELKATIRARLEEQLREELAISEASVKERVFAAITSGVSAAKIKRALGITDHRTYQALVASYRPEETEVGVPFVINDRTSFTVYRVGEKVVEVTGKFTVAGYPQYPLDEDTWDEFNDSMYDAVRAAWKERYGE